MAPRFFADLVVLVHTAFVAFVILGALLVLRWPRLFWLHLPAAAWGAWIEFAGWICPLTPLENALRNRAGQVGYAGGFIEHYFLPVLYPAGLTREAQLELGASLVLLTLAVYTVFFIRLARQRRLFRST
jgi:hypothetical protein